MGEALSQGIISPGTPITVGLAITLIGGVYWLTKMYSITKQSERDIVKIWVEIETIKSNNTMIVDRMARIETKLDSVLEVLRSK